MIAELILTLCLSPKECATVRRQFSGPECIERAASELDEMGRDPDDPPYLEGPPKCMVLTTGDES